MKLDKYKVLGHEVEYHVTEDSAEFNKLDPKRPDAANDEANNNIVYRTLNPDTRQWFLHGLDDETVKWLTEHFPKDSITGEKINYQPFSGVEESMKLLFDGDELGKDPKGDDETPLRKREQARNSKGALREKDGQPIMKMKESEEAYYNRVLALSVKYKKFLTEELARAHFDPHIKRLASYVPFDITMREPGEGGIKRLAERFKVAAAKAITLGTLDKLNKLFSESTGKKFEATGDTTKLYTGKYPTKENGQEVQKDFSVSDKDAEALGWLIKEYQDWKAANELAGLTE